MTIAKECDCSPSLAQALGAFAGYGELDPVRRPGPVTYCFWCGERIVEPEQSEGEVSIPSTTH